MKRTSQSHPMQIASIPLGHGTVGVTFCPGKKAESIHGPPWDRDLDTDLQAIEAWGASTVVTLLESHEFGLLNVPDLPSVMNRRFDWLHMPIADLGTPDTGTEGMWSTHSERLLCEVKQGKRVLFHCRGGLGRAGMMAARLLMDGGLSAGKAIELVRSRRPGAIETPDQESYLANHPSFLSHASLLGLAVGDATGAAIEFSTFSEIEAVFEGQVDVLLPAYGKVGAITDDTQMALFTAEGTIRTIYRASTKGIGSGAAVVHHALLRWLLTQGVATGVPMDRKVGLIALPEMHTRRAPGTTCITSLQAAKSLGVPARNQSKGCGTIMRVAPLAFGVDRSHLRQFAIETSALTHGHRTGQLAAAFWAELVSHVVRGDTVEDAVAALLKDYTRIDGSDEVANAVAKAMDAKPDGSPESVSSLGEGWIAEECLSIALYSAINAEGFNHGISMAVKHSGDSDSCGAVAGSLLGILYPEEVLNGKASSQLELQSHIRKLSKDLHNFQLIEFERFEDPFYAPW